MAGHSATATRSASVDCAHKIRCFLTFRSWAGRDVDPVAWKRGWGAFQSAKRPAEVQRIAAQSGSLSISCVSSCFVLTKCVNLPKLEFANLKGVVDVDANDRSFYRGIRRLLRKERPASPEAQRSTGAQSPVADFRISQRRNFPKLRGSKRSGLATVSGEHSKFISAKSNRLVRQIRVHYSIEASLSDRTSESILPRHRFSFARSCSEFDHRFLRLGREEISRANGRSVFQS